MVATAKLDPAEIERLTKSVDDMKYLPIDDVVTLLQQGGSCLEHLGVSRHDAAVVGITPDAVRQLLLALLRVPAQIEELTADPLPEPIAKDEARKYAIARVEAAGIAQKLGKAAEKREATYEIYRELVAASTDPVLTRQILLSAETPSMPLQLERGETLPEVKPLPRALPSSKVHDVLLRVRNVDEESSVALVRLVGPINPSAIALEGLMESVLPMTFNTTNRSVVRRLLAAQLIDQPVKFRVQITRALRHSDGRLTRLSYKGLTMTSAQRTVVSSEAQQLCLELETSTD